MVLRPLVLALSLLLSACPEPPEATPVETRRAGPLQVGAAEVPVDLPVGAPLGGYTARCWIMTGASSVDDREGAYTVAFDTSVGVQTRPTVRAFWFENGQEDLVLLKFDAIYAFDGILPALTARLEAATGRELDGRVVVSASHTHHGWANYSDQTAFYLGGDRYDHEVFLRLVGSMEAAAVAAWERRQEAQVGVGHLRDWDPDNRVYRDRRGENDDLQLWDDLPAGSYKDPTLWMLRADDLAGNPIAVLYGLAIHGILLDADNPMASVDAPGALDLRFQEAFGPGVVVGHFQTGAGDASPAGQDDFYARIESVGENAVDSLLDLWSRIPVAPVEVTLETVTRSFRQTSADIHVTRNGTVDWSYLPYEDGYEPDLAIYAEDGSLLSPFDEFNVENGAAFCGDATPYLTGWDIGTPIPPYASCTQVEGFETLLENVFELDPLTLPLQESEWSTLTASLLGPLPTLKEDGSTTEEPLLFGFFPGEACALYTEMFRRRVAEELGIEDAVAVAFSQDHEGYLMLAEDWLQGGYEPSINLWGPLQGDHLMDRWFEMARVLLTESLEPADPMDLWQAPAWGPDALPERIPDTTPEAGTLLAEAPVGLYTPLLTEEEFEGGAVPDLAWPEEVPRVQGMVQLAWQGGDPAVDLPRVVLEREEAGSWVEVTTPSGRPVTESLHDILLTWTPDPLTPADAVQEHRWWAGWQAVSSVEDRAGLPEGRYRFHITGRRATGGDRWPWPTEPYEIVTEAFTVVPAAITLEVDGEDLLACIEAPERGFRYVAPGGSVRGCNPLPEGDVAVERLLEDGNTEQEWATVDASLTEDGRTRLVGAGAGTLQRVTVTDAYGNTGEARFVAVQR